LNVNDGTEQIKYLMGYNKYYRGYNSTTLEDDIVLLFLIPFHGAIHKIRNALEGREGSRLLLLFVTEGGGGHGFCYVHLRFFPIFTDFYRFFMKFYENRFFFAQFCSIASVKQYFVRFSLKKAFFGQKIIILIFKGGLARCYVFEREGS